MRRVGKLIIYGAITIAIALLINFINVYPLTATSTNQPTQTTVPKRLNINFNISELDDLKVSEGERIDRDEIIANRE